MKKIEIPELLIELKKFLDSFNVDSEISKPKKDDKILMVKDVLKLKVDDYNEVLPEEVIYKIKQKFVIFYSFKENLVFIIEPDCLSI